MALLTDAGVLTPMDLANEDSQVSRVADAEGIDILAKIDLAKSYVSQQLDAELSAEYGTSQYSSGNVVCTSGLRRWLTLETLATIYRDAYNRQLNDRYKGRWDSFNRMSQDACRVYWQGGAGVVTAPLSAPSVPDVEVAQGSFAASVWYVAISNASGTSESVASEVLPVNAGDGSTIVVTSPVKSGNATGWNVYVGELPDQLRKQNTQTLTFGSKWTLPSSGLVNGSEPSAGQQPDLVLRRLNRLQRG